MLLINDVARILEVHPDTIKHWWQQGKLRAYRVSPDGDLRFLREDVAIAYFERLIRKGLGY
jgi:DNA-binding transcriptional MerR regulator